MGQKPSKFRYRKGSPVMVAYLWFSKAFRLCKLYLSIAWKQKRTAMNMTLKDDDLRPYRVDLGGDIYTAMRAIQGFAYDDALDSTDMLATGRLFIPGCSLAAYSQELTLAVYRYLSDLGEVDGISVACCGNVLDFAAPPESRARYADELSARLEARGVTRIVSACPNCYRAYRNLARSGRGAALEVVAVSEILATQKVRFASSAEAPFASVCMHDSCPDRSDGVFASSVRALFAETDVREMAHSRTCSRCCGVGRLLALRDPIASMRMTHERLAEFDATGAECLVTCCANCALALKTADRSSYHYLELIFGISIDWAAVTAAYQRALSP
jgi:Fe-S oxidoreductase